MQTHYFVNKGPSSQGYGFSNGHVWMWELDCEESWAPKNWCFWIVLDLLAVQGTVKSLLQHHSSKSILRHSVFFTVQHSHPYMTIGKTIALTRWTLVGKVMSLLLNMMSTLVILFLPSSKCLLISWLQSPSTVILETKKIKSVTVSIGSPSICYDGHDLNIFECWISSQLFYSLLSPSSRDSLVPLHFLPLEWYHLHVWGYWYFSPQFWSQLVSHPAQHFAWCTLYKR